jgi:hypothetical protein
MSVYHLESNLSVYGLMLRQAISCPNLGQRAFLVDGDETFEDLVSTACPLKVTLRYFLCRLPLGDELFPQCIHGAA